MVSNYRRSITGETEPSDAATVEGVFLPWLEQAACLPGRGPLVTAVAILAQSRNQDRRHHILVLPSRLAAYGLSRATMYRSLVALEDAGLIEVRRNRGSSPLVSILPVPTEYAALQENAPTTE